MTDPEIIDQLRSFYRMKGWAVLREAADRIESIVVASEPDAGNYVGVTDETTDDFDLTDKALDEWDRDEDWVHDSEMGAR